MNFIVIVAYLTLSTGQQQQSVYADDHCPVKETVQAISDSNGKASDIRIISVTCFKEVKIFRF